MYAPFWHPLYIKLVDGLLSDFSMSSIFSFCTHFSLERPKISTTRGRETKGHSLSWHRWQKARNKGESDRRWSVQERSDLSDRPQACHQISEWFVVLKIWHRKNHLGLISYSEDRGFSCDCYLRLTFSLYPQSMRKLSG